MRLTKRQRNDIFRTLSANGVEPESCSFRQRGLFSIAGLGAIYHDASRSDFTLHADQDRAYKANMIVGGAEWSRCTSCTWDQVMEVLGTWAREVRYETEAPDLWAQVRRVQQMLAAARSDDASNAPFTSAEQAEISARFDQVKAFALDNLELQSEQLAAIDHGLDELKEASKRVGRKDWLMMAQGVMYGLIVNDLVPAHVVQSVFRMALTGIAHIFGIGVPPPAISA